MYKYYPKFYFIIIIINFIIVDVPGKPNTLITDVAFVKYNELKYDFTVQ